MPDLLTKMLFLAAKRPNLLHKNKIHYQLHHLLHKTKFTTDCLIYFIKIIWSPNARLTLKDNIFGQKRPHLLHKNETHH